MSFRDNMDFTKWWEERIMSEQQKQTDATDWNSKNTIKPNNAVGGNSSVSWRWQREVVPVRIVGYDNDEEVLNITVQRVDPASTFDLPRKKYVLDGAYDFFCPKRVEIYPGERKTIMLGLKMAIPVGYMALFVDKSGWAKNKGLHLFGGLGDAGFTGEWGATMYNSTEELIVIEENTAFIQMHIQKVLSSLITEGLVLDNIEDKNARNEKGFSSGTK